MNNTRLETQEVENAVVSIHFFPIPGCFLTSPFRSVQSPPITREIQPARTILCVPQSGIVPIHSCPAWIFLADFNVKHHRHHHAKHVILIAAGSGIGSSGDRVQSMISSKVTFTKFATLEWVLLESYTDWIGRTNPFRAPGNEVLRGDVDVLDLPSGIQWAAVAGHAYTHTAIFIELLKAPPVVLSPVLVHGCILVSLPVLLHRLTNICYKSLQLRSITREIER
ncbi:hypothetical protein B0H14DRAFT_2565444 [Mycena olivaceomarginata]|nr:hypothetical protein B0H14DRAFT_2565444 [Mycena olivaceomarginata]